MGEMIKIKADTEINAYLAMPSSAPKGAVLVIHEVWNLVDHTKSVADRFAEQGYIALAPELLFEIDFSKVDVKDLQLKLFDPKTRSEIQPKLRQLLTPMQNPDFGVKTLARVKACFDYLYDNPSSNHNVAVTGFCFGGTYSYSLAVAEPRLKIAFPFYGHSDQSVEELKNIKCKVRAFYGQNDEGLISGLDDLKKRMSEAKVDYRAKVYEGTGHAFFNDTNPYAYNETAAKDAWKTVLDNLSQAF